MTLLRLVVAAAALTFACAFEAADPEPGAAFNKEELEKILRAEHSTKISNVYDSENGIQCAAPHRAPRMQPPPPPLLPPPPRCRRHRRRISRQRANAAALLPPPPLPAAAAHPPAALLVRRYTWNIELQELCAGVDGVCSKEEL